MLVVAGCCYLGIVTARQGPPPNGDTVPLTAVTTALADGDLRAAASVASLPNPPGYALLTAPLVASAPSLVGAPAWCTTASRARADSTDRGAHPCGQGGGPPWYRSQAVLGVASWLVLALGGLALLRAAGADSLPRQAALLAFLAFLPAASSAIVQLYHPQDVVGLGLALAALSQTLRHRWILAGVLFGIALLCKQFSVLLLLPALAAAPASRSRIRLGGTAALVVAAGLLPFLAVAPRTTLDNLSGFGSGGAVSGLTVLTLAGVTGGIASAVARDAPVVFALVVCLWAARRPGRPASGPVGLVALALVCTSSRLVFESVVFPYYLLAPSVLFLLLDLVARRSPHRSLAWCAAAAFFVAFRPAGHAVAAFGTLLLAVTAVAAGFLELAPSGALSPEAVAQPQ